MAGPSLYHRPPSMIRRLLSHSAAGGLALMGAAALALIAANSPLESLYSDLLSAHVAGLSVLHWINDGLMALFFLMVGLEIKREVLDGHLATWRKRVLPGCAAAGGMIGPALVYLAVNGGANGHPAGWAIPAATDIAFALGVLSLLGPRVPPSLKVFLTALAIVDDLGAIVIIALFYAGGLNGPALGGAGFAMLVLIGLNRLGAKALTPYLVVGASLWFLVLLSGVHATLAGVLLALTIPLRRRAGHADDMTSPLHKLEHTIAPAVSFVVLPIFGFANAGVAFDGVSMTSLTQPLPLGVIAGLFVGKQAGVFLSVAAVIRFGRADMPAKATWSQLYGIALLCGIGFTMSLFIGLLAFPDDPALQNDLKLGVLTGSVLSALGGLVVLMRGRC